MTNEHKNIFGFIFEQLIEDLRIEMIENFLKHILQL